MDKLRYKYPDTIKYIFEAVISDQDYSERQEQDSARKQQRSSTQTLGDFTRERINQQKKIENNINQHFEQYFDLSNAHEQQEFQIQQLLVTQYLKIQKKLQKNVPFPRQTFFLAQIDKWQFKYYDNQNKVLQNSENAVKASLSIQYSYQPQNNQKVLLISYINARKVLEELDIFIQSNRPAGIIPQQSQSPQVQEQLSSSTLQSQQQSSSAEGIKFKQFIIPEGIYPLQVALQTNLKALAQRFQQNQQAAQQQQQDSSPQRESMETEINVDFSAEKLPNLVKFLSIPENAQSIPEDLLKERLTEIINANQSVLYMMYYFISYQLLFQKYNLAVDLDVNQVFLNRLSSSQYHFIFVPRFEQFAQFFTDVFQKNNVEYGNSLEQIQSSYNNKLQSQNMAIMLFEIARVLLQSDSFEKQTPNEQNILQQLKAQRQQFVFDFNINTIVREEFFLKRDPFELHSKYLLLPSLKNGPIIYTMLTSTEINPLQSLPKQIPQAAQIFKNSIYNRVFKFFEELQKQNENDCLNGQVKYRLQLNRKDQIEKDFKFYIAVTDLVPQSVAAQQRSASLQQQQQQQQSASLESSKDSAFLSQSSLSPSSSLSSTIRTASQPFSQKSSGSQESPFNREIQIQSFDGENLIVSVENHEISVTLDSIDETVFFTAAQNASLQDIDIQLKTDRHFVTFKQIINNQRFVKERRSDEYRNKDESIEIEENATQVHKKYQWNALLTNLAMAIDTCMIWASVYQDFSSSKFGAVRGQREAVRIANLAEELNFYALMVQKQYRKLLKVDNNQQKGQEQQQVQAAQRNDSEMDTEQ